MPVGDNASWSTSSQRARQSSLGLPSAVASDGPSTACPPWLQPPDGTSQLCDTLPSQMCPRLLRVIPAALGRPTHPQCFRGPSSKTSNIWCCQSCGKLFSSSRGPQGGTLLPSLPPSPSSLQWVPQRPDRQHASTSALSAQRHRCLPGPHHWGHSRATCGAGVRPASQTTGEQLLVRPAPGQGVQRVKANR